MASRRDSQLHKGVCLFFSEQIQPDLVTARKLFSTQRLQQFLDLFSLNNKLFPGKSSLQDLKRFPSPNHADGPILFKGLE